MQSTSWANLRCVRLCFVLDKSIVQDSLGDNADLSIIDRMELVSVDMVSSTYRSLQPTVVYGCRD